MAATDSTTGELLAAAEEKRAGGGGIQGATSFKWGDSQNAIGLLGGEDVESSVTTAGPNREKLTLLLLASQESVDARNEFRDR